MARSIVPGITRVYYSLMILASLILLFALLVYSAYAYNLITFPYDYDQGEGFELVDTILFSQFQCPYQNTENFPFYSSNYPPLFHIIAAPFVWVFGESYWYGRLLGFVGTLITASAIAFTVYDHEKNRWIAIFSALAFLSSNTIYHIGPLLRQHMTMVMFETLAIVLLTNAFRENKQNQKVIGFILLIAAGYTKQLAVITAIATIAWIILRNPLRGIRWSAGFIFAGSLIFIGLTLATNGEWWTQAIVANVNAFDPYQTFGLILLWLRLHALLILPALLLVLYEIYFDRISLFAAWFVFTVVLGAIASGTWGAGDSYFATAIAATCIMSGIFFSRVINQNWIFPQDNFYHVSLASLSRFQYLLAPLILLVIPLMYVGYGICTFKMPTEGILFGSISDFFQIQPNVMGRHYDSATYNVLGYANIGHFVTAEDRAAGDYIVEQIRQSDGFILSEEAGFNLIAGREVITNPTQLRNLWLAGLWKGDVLLSMIKNHEFDLIITRAQFYPVPILEEFGHSYTIQEVVHMNGFDYWLWVPIR